MTFRVSIWNRRNKFTQVQKSSEMNNTEVATFAAGCFWGVEKWFKKSFDRGIIRTRVGYCGGATSNPSYHDVCGGKTGHAESVEVVFDPTVVRYEDLVTLFFRVHDSTTPNRQGNDRGTQYRSVIFFHSDAQREVASRVKEDAQKHFKQPIVTEIVPAAEFHEAEEYHQGYLEKNPGGYCNHRLLW